MKRVTTTCFAIAFSCHTSVMAAIITVDDDGAADFDNIQAAVDSAVNGDEIIVQPGTYTASDPSAFFVVDLLGKGVMLRSAQGAGVTFIDGQATRRGVGCLAGENAATIIDGFTVRNCRASDADLNNNKIDDPNEDCGAGFFIYNASPTIRNCIATNNQSNDDGGGLYCEMGGPKIEDCIFEDNEAGQFLPNQSGGGALFHNSFPLVDTCSFIDNDALLGGGVAITTSGSAFGGGEEPIFLQCTFQSNGSVADETRGGGMYIWAPDDAPSEPTISSCNFENNRGFRGAGAYTSGATNPWIVGCNFTGNTASDAGGAAANRNYTENSGLGIDYSDCTFSNNRAESGGAIFMDNADVTLFGCELLGNTANWGGGMRIQYCNATMNGCSFQANQANGDSNTGGGAISFSGSFSTLDKCTFTSNVSNPIANFTSSGGAILNRDSSPVFSLCTFSSNVAKLGGAMANSSYHFDQSSGSSNPTVIDCTFHQNTSADAGGAVFISLNESGSFQSCVFSENFATTNGGAVAVSSGSGDFEDCVFSENACTEQGGAVYVNGTASPEFTTCDFLANTASIGAGIASDDATTTIKDGWFYGNDASTVGGAIAILGNDGLVTIEACYINGNHASDAGGALHIADNTTAVLDTTMANNSSDAGGGVYISGGTCSFYNSEINDNWTTLGDGGGMCCTGGTTALQGCRLFGNDAVAYGGAIECQQGGSLTVEHCLIIGPSFPSSVTYGGGIDIDASAATVVLNNVVIRQCEAAFEGGGMYNAAFETQITDCTIRENTAPIGAGLLADLGADTTLQGTTVCDNNNDDVSGPWINNGGNAVGGDCCLPDLNNDGIVNGADLATLLGLWGSDCLGCKADLNGDGLIDGADLAVLLGGWGDCE